MDGVAGRRCDHRDPGTGNPRGAGPNQTLARCVRSSLLTEAEVTDLRPSVRRRFPSPHDFAASAPSDPRLRR